MTVKEYISQTLKGIGELTDAQYADISFRIDLDDDYTKDNANIVGEALCKTLADIIPSLFVDNVSEAGFSISWDKSKLGNFYWYLCKKYGVSPEDDVLSLVGVNTIRDRSNIW